MGGSSWSLVCASSCSCALCGVADNDSSGPNTVACGIAGNDSSGPDMVACRIAGNDFRGPDTVACGVAGNGCSGPDTIDACSCAGMDSCTVHADRQTRAVTTTIQAAINVRWRVPRIVSVSPEPRNGVELHPCQGQLVSL